MINYLIFKFLKNKVNIDLDEKSNRRLKGDARVDPNNNDHDINDSDSNKNDIINVIVNLLLTHLKCSINISE